jgi:ABC-2 type transport system ATP-binding protein
MEMVSDMTLPSETPAIWARNLSKTYSFIEKEAGLAGSFRSLFRGRRVSVEAVKSIDLEIRAGEVIGLIGPNGAGKTTTLKMLAGILYPTAGELRVLGFLPYRREKAFLQNLSFVTGQRNRLFWDLPAEEYFEFCRVIYEIPRETYQKNLRRLIELAEIGEILKTPQRKLSAGQRKRCEIVAALLHDPKVIFLDEPTNALDLVNARKIREFIREKGKEGHHAILLTSHNMSDIEQVCQKVIILNRGTIAFQGPLEDLYRVQRARRQIRVSFREPVPPLPLEEMGRVLRRNGREAWLEVEPEKAATVASRLFAQFPVRDISILDPPLEEMIEAIYRGPAVPDRAMDPPHPGPR